MSILRPVFNPEIGHVVAKHPEWLKELNLLVAYPYLCGVDKLRLWQTKFASWMLDSGAFSVFMSGATIHIADYIREVKKRVADPRLTDVVSLDVIGDWRGSLRNTETMWKHGIEAIPVYHHGEPWDVLTGLARDYPMICVSGFTKRAMMNDTARMAYVSEIFSRVWPAKIHGLGLTSEAVQMKFPFWSVDSTVWLNPGRFGCYRTFQYKVVVKRGRYWLDGDLFYILKLQRRLKARWAHELARFAPREAMTA